MTRDRHHGPQVSRRDEGQDGYALLSTIWFLGLIAVIAVTINLFTVNSTAVIASAMDRTRLDALTRAALESVAVTILSQQPGAPLAGRLETVLREGRSSARWRPEAGRVDLNLAPPELLAAALQAAGLERLEAERWTARIVERRDLASRQQPQNAAAMTFQHVAELRDIGLPASTFERLQDLVTVYSGAARIDPRHADRRLLAALPDMTEIKLRLMEGIGTASGAEAEKLLAEAGEAARFLSIEARPLARIMIASRLGNGAQSLTQIVLICFPDDKEPYRVMSWQDLPAEQSAGANP